MNCIENFFCYIIVAVIQNGSYDKKYLVGQGNIGIKRIFPKYLFGGFISASKVKNDFSLKSSNQKIIFSIINLVNWQVNRLVKVGKYLFYLSKK